MRALEEMLCESRFFFIAALGLAALGCGESFEKNKGDQGPIGAFGLPATSSSFCEANRVFKGVEMDRSEQGVFKITYSDNGDLY